MVGRVHGFKIVAKSSKYLGNNSVTLREGGALIPKYHYGHAILHICLLRTLWLPTIVQYPSIPCLMLGIIVHHGHALEFQ